MQKLKKNWVEIVIVVTIVLSVVILILLPKADYSNDKNLATFRNLYVTELAKEGSKSKTYYVSMSGGNVTNLRISVSGETWQSLHVGDRISFVYDMGWGNIIEWK